MAYFPNGTSGMCFDEQCMRCKLGERFCPIWRVQHEYNYEACNNKTGRAILDALVKNDGTCAMYEAAKDLLADPEMQGPITYTWGVMDLGAEGKE